MNKFFGLSQGEKVYRIEALGGITLLVHPLDMVA